MNNKVYVTGGSGFVGRGLIHQLAASGSAVTAAVRGALNAAGAPTWVDDMTGHEVVVHCAARVHVMDEPSADPLTEFRRVNVDGTLQLARQAAAVGVKRFVFISSIKVNGESSVPGQPFTAFDQPAPQDPYAVSKWEAEQGLHEVARSTGMEVVIIRPVLVYGAGVKGNFRSMLRWIDKGVPLPLGSVHNQRSLLGLANLVGLIVTCVEHPAAAGQTFLVSDGEDLSTTELLRWVGEALGRPARLIPVPIIVLRLGAALLGKAAVAQRLCGSLQVDMCHTRDTLDWTPPVSVDAGLRTAACAYRTE